MKKAILTISMLCFSMLLVHAQGSMPLMELKLAGNWQIDSVSFKRPVDMNGDGIRNANAVKEYSACMRVQQMTFGGDYTAVSTIGTGVDGCTEERTKYAKWVLERKVSEEEQENYDKAKDKKSLKKPEKRTYLTLSYEDDPDEKLEFLVVELTKDMLQVVGEVIIEDSNDLALIVWKKIKK
jgi:hypothetical protein